jgi:hypothetical protein
MVGWLSITTVCSGSLIYLLNQWGVMEEVMGGLVNCRLPSGLSPGSEKSGGELVNGPLPLTYPWGASISALWILLYIFLVQQEANAQWNTVVISKQQWYLNPFVPEHRIAHFWAILSLCYLCCGILVFIELPKFGWFYENQNSSNGLCAMGTGDAQNKCKTRIHSNPYLVLQNLYTFLD